MSRTVASQDHSVAELASAASEGCSAAAVQVRLRDGTPVLVRPVRPDDVERVARGFEQLSPTSRYLRFHSVVRDSLTPEQLRAVTRVDQRGHAVWVALEACDPESPIVGMASYVRVPDLPSVAEVGLAVIDRVQGRGVGTVLLHALVEVARTNDIDVLRSYVLAENATMLHLLEELGGVRATMSRGVEVVDLAIAAGGRDLAGTPVHRATRAATKRPHQARRLVLHSRSSDPEATELRG